MVRNHRPPSQSWRTFLDNHISQLVSVDFFTVPTVWFQVLFVFVVLAHDRRRVLHFNVTAHPTAVWTAQQILEAFPFEIVPKYLLRDRDAIYGFVLRQQIEALGITEVLGTPRSPWQRAYVERIIGSIRRDCLDHVIVLDETSLRRILRRYFDYYHESRTHLSLDKDAPIPRPLQPSGRIVAIPQVCGLHHRYERRAARWWAHSTNFWFPPTSQPLSVLKNPLFRAITEKTGESRLVRIGFGPPASNRPNGAVLVLNGVFGRDRN